MDWRCDQDLAFYGHTSSRQPLASIIGYRMCYLLLLLDSPRPEPLVWFGCCTRSHCQAEANSSHSYIRSNHELNRHVRASLCGGGGSGAQLGRARPRSYQTSTRQSATHHAHTYARTHARTESARQHGGLRRTAVETTTGAWTAAITPHRTPPPAGPRALLNSIRLPPSSIEAAAPPPHPQSSSHWQRRRGRGGAHLPGLLAGGAGHAP